MIACHNCVHYEVCKAIIGEKELFINDIACRFSSECGAYKNAETFVEIVRCKDCKHSSEDGGYDSIEQLKTHLNCRRINSGFIGCAVVPKEGFCNYGERKDNE